MDGYLELEIGGALRPMKLGMGAWEIICTERNTTTQSMLKGLNEFSFIGWIAYSGLKFAYLAGLTELSPPKSFHETMLWIEKLDGKTMSKIGETFAKSTILGQTMKEYLDSMNQDDDKKKVKNPLKK